MEQKAVRVVSPFWGREEQADTIELISIDASANPYIALGASSHVAWVV